MNVLDSLVLGILQGITEFLPISSSGHLVLGEHFLGLSVPDLKVFDVVVHVGTLLAIIVYFWKDFVGLLKAFFGLFVGRLEGEYVKLIGWIVIGTIPAVLAGLYGEKWIDANFRNIVSVGGWMVMIGVMFLLGEWIYKRYWRGSGEKLSFGKAFVIGLAQALALVPGISRSGSTIVAGIFQGVKREEAARFSFLLGIPAIAGAGLLTFMHMGEPSGVNISTQALGVGFLSSFVFGLLSVWFLMKFLKKHSLVVFALYLIAVGGSVLASI